MRRFSLKRLAMTNLALLAAWLIVALSSLSIGSVSIPVATSLEHFKNRMMGNPGGEDPLATILFAVRLPRVLLASLVGAALAAAGAGFQSLLRNPLADPYVLGVSTGASTGTILYSILRRPYQGGFIFGRPAAAFAGALVTIAAVYITAAGGGRSRHNTQRLLLAGIIMASFISSINVFLLASTNQADLRGILYWLIGDLSKPVDASIYPVTAMVLTGLFLLYLFSHSLNLISTGEEDAAILGVEVRRVKFAVYLIASFVTGAVVSVSGPIAYIGLICPHIGRMMFGSDNRILFPAVFIFGGIFTLAADTLARTILSPVELPVGVITALCGAPLFIYLLHRRQGGA